MFPLSRISPEDAHVDPAGIVALVDALEEIGNPTHSLMIARHGSVIAEGWWNPFEPGDIHLLHSLSKSFTSTAVGIAIGEGLLSLDDRVIDFFPDKRPSSSSDHLAAMKVRHLLSMSCGHSENVIFRNFEIQDWAEAFLHQPVPHEPGTTFMYNTCGTYMLGVILSRLTNGRLLDYLRSRLLDPLGICRATWMQCPLGFDFGGSGFSATTEAVLRLGMLYLQDGVWEGARILPEGWVNLATAKHVSNGDDPKSDWAQGYGFQFWRCQHGFYRGDGAFGQFCLVMPELDAVIAITAGGGDMQRVLDEIYRHFVPACDRAPTGELGERLVGLELAPRGVVRLSEPFQSSYHGDTGDLMISFDGTKLRLQCNDERLDVGLDSWILGEAAIERTDRIPVAARVSSVLDGLAIHVVDRHSPQSTLFRISGPEVQTERVGTFLPAEGPVYRAVNG